MQLLGFAFKEFSKQVDDYGDVYDYSDGVYPDAVVDDDANACAQGVAQRKNGKGKTPLTSRQEAYDGADPQDDFYVVV